jgi:hypothetical protein
MGEPRLTPERVSFGRRCGAFTVIGRSGSYKMRAPVAALQGRAGRDVQIHVERPVVARGATPR